MIWKIVALACFVVLLHWKQSCGETFGCTPVMANRSLWLSNIRPSVNISSPTTFPSNQSVYCSWRFHVLKGYRIRIHFNSFDLRNSTNCSSSAVELAEKEEGISISLGRYCGGLVPDDVVSNRSFVSVIYTSANGSTLQHPGFHAAISLAPAETCSPDHHRDANNNIVLSGTSGRLFSPLFPLNYGVKIQCRWTIKVPEGHRIKLSFQAFHLGLKGVDNCDKVDRVEVRDSFDKNNPSYGIFCGNVVPPPIYTVGPRMLVTFVSDEERVFQGFEARFNATSEGVCTPHSRIVQLNLTNNSTGRLSSPDYPLQFPSVSACYWRLKAPKGYRIKLRFTTLNIQGNCKENMNGTEWIRVDDHFTTDFSSVASYWGTYCGGVQPPVIYSTRNELQVFFTSSYTGGKDDKSAKQPQQSTDIGFYTIYEVTTQGYTSRCRTDVTSQKPITLQGHTDSLVSPGYPHSYPIITCTWKIKVPDGYIVEVNIKDFQMDCAGGSKLVVGEDSFCGSDKPSGLLTSESNLKIQMIANEARDDRGFHATFSMTEREVDVASIVPWIVIPIVVVAISLTAFVSWRRRARALDRRSSFKTSIIKRNRTQSSMSQT